MNFPATGLVSIVQGGDYAGDVMSRKNRKNCFLNFFAEMLYIKISRKKHQTIFLNQIRYYFCTNKIVDIKSKES